MNYRTFVTLAVIGITPLLNGQADTSSSTGEDAGTTRDLGLERARQTIDGADREAERRREATLDLADSAARRAGNPGTDGDTDAEFMDAPGERPGAETPAGQETDDIFMELPGESQGDDTVGRDERISVDFPDEDVRNIIRNVADLYGLNVVIPETLVGRITIRLRDVTWQQIFNVVLEPMNFTWIVDDNIIKIRSQDELMREPMDTRVFIINFAQAGELRNSVGNLVDTGAGGRIQVDTRSNALVITERPSRLNSIQQIIETLDRPTEQVMIESRFVEVTQRDVKNLGVDWQSLSGYSMQAGPFQREYGLDRESGPTRSDTRTEGFTLNPDGSVDIINSRIREFDNDFSRILTHEDTALFSADAFQVVLSALEQNTDSRLVSNPTIVTVNNTKAQINIGEEYPIPRYTYNQERGTFEVSGFDFKPIGILLNVLPQINSAGFISLDIRPEISSRTGQVGFGGEGGAQIPIITTRRTESTVTLKSGFTLAIGGLIETVTNNGESRVPVLGNIPGVGRLFRSESTSEDQRNLIVFITARILSGDGATYEDVFSDRRLYEMGIRKRDIPGEDVSPEEDALFSRLRRESDEVTGIEVEARLRQQLRALEQAREEQRARAEQLPVEEERVIRRRYQ
ncbi:MAG: hypothetical protein JJU00_12025 [Opitutales bacterium]|nr:hypothetical protein [Opitutales bacterium]